MNRSKILAVANAIESHALRAEGLFGLIGFNMKDWIDVPFLPGEGWVKGNKDHIDNCGTTACIAGWTCLLDLPAEKIKEYYEEAISEVCANNLDRAVDHNYAAELLGLLPDAANALFMATGSQKSMSFITAQESIEVLRRVADYTQDEFGGSLEHFIIEQWELVTKPVDA